MLCSVCVSDQLLLLWWCLFKYFTVLSLIWGGMTEIINLAQVMFLLLGGVYYALIHLYCLITHL